MARVKIDIPGKVMASFRIPVRITDINYGNHVGNDAFVSIIHEARIQWLKQYGFTEIQIEDIGLIMTTCALNLKMNPFTGMWLK